MPGVILAGAKANVKQIGCVRHKRCPSFSLPPVLLSLYGLVSHQVLSSLNSSDVDGRIHSGVWDLVFKWPLEVEGHKPEVCVKRVVSSLQANLDQREMGDRSPPCLLPSKECSEMRFLCIFS